MLRGDTIAETANRLKIARHLAFQWRHKILASLASFQANEIKNEATLTVEDFNYSTKGLDKRKQACNLPSHLYKKMLKVTFINNQEGDVTLRVHNLSKILPLKLKKQTIGLMNKTRIIHYKPQNPLSRGLQNTTARLSREKDIKKLKKRQYITSIMTKRWLTKFRGVASKYLQHYLNWFVFLRCYESPRQSLIKTNIYIHSTLNIYKEYKKLRDVHAFTIT